MSVAAMDFKSFELSYQTFEDERLPLIGIYFVSRYYPFSGLCREFEIDLDRFIHGRGKRIFPKVHLYEFISEDTLLECLERDRIQGIRTNLAEGISFKKITGVIAELHRDDFFNRYFWLKDPLDKKRN